MAAHDPRDGEKTGGTPAPSSGETEQPETQEAQQPAGPTEAEGELDMPEPPARPAAPEPEPRPRRRLFLFGRRAHKPEPVGPDVATPAVTAPSAAEAAAPRPPDATPPPAEPPSAEPPAEEPPAGEPPVEEPPIEEPPVEAPPAGEPPVAEQPSTEPSAGAPGTAVQESDAPSADRPESLAPPSAAEPAAPAEGTPAEPAVPPPPAEPEAAPPAAARRAAPGPRRRPRWPWYALAAVLVVVLVVVAAVLYAPRYAEQRLTAALHDMGFTAARLSVDTLGLHRAVVRDLSLGPELTAGEVVAAYTPAGIREGRFDRVTVRGLRGRLSMDGTGPLFGSLEAPLRSLLAAEGGGPPAALPPVTLEDAVIEVATPLGPATLHLAGTVEPEPGALAAAGLEVEAELPLGRLAGRLEASAGEDGSVSGSLIIQDGALAAAEAGSTGLAGFVQFATSSAGLERLDSDLTLTQPAIAGMAFVKGRLRIGFSPELASLNLLLDSGDGPLDLRGTAVVQDPYGAGALSAIVEAAAGPGAPVWSMANLPDPTDGRLRLTATLSADLPDGAAFRPAGLIDALLADQGLGASLQFDLEGMAWPGLGREVSVAGGLDLSHDPGGIVASVPAEILGEITPAPELLDALGLEGRAREPFSGRINFSLAFAQPLLVLTGPDTVTLSGRPLLALMAREGAELSGDVWGTVVLGRDGTLRQFRIDAGKLSALELEFDGVRLASATVEGELAGTPQAFAGTLRLTARAPELDVPGVRLADLDLSLACDVSGEDGMLALRLSGNDSRIQAQLLTPKTIAQGRPLRLALRPARDPLLAMHRGPPGGAGAPTRVAFAVSTGPFPFDVHASPHTLIATRLARLDLAGTWSAADGLALTATTAGGRIDMPQQDLTATGVAVEARIPAGAPIRVRFRMASLGQGADHSPYLVPLAVTGSASVSDERVEAEFSGSAAREGLVLTVKARHRLADDTGSADLELKPVVFSSDGGLQPWQLFPPIGRAVVRADGTIAASGRIAWGETLTPKIDVALKDLTLVTPQVALRGINGVLTLDGLDPLSTPPGQEIAIGQVDLGLPLTDGLLTFRIEPPSTLRIDRARLSLAGGEIAAAPTAIDWSGGTQEITLTARDLRLQALLELADIEGLSGSGRLAGAIPVVIRDGAVLVNGAVLAAQEPGILKYDTSEAPQALAGAGESAALALTALRNFHYTALRLEIDRGADAEMRVRIKLDGSNPDLYDGYPVRFNFNVSGKLDQVLSRGLAGYRIPDRIRERLMQFQ